MEEEVETIGPSTSFNEGQLTISLSHTIPTGNYQSIKPSLTFTIKASEEDVAAVFKKNYKTLRFLYAQLLLNEFAAAKQINNTGVPEYAIGVLNALGENQGG